MIIALSGIDNCGKTTQIDLLIEALEGRGQHARRVWGRVGYTSGIEYAKRTLRRVLGSMLPPPGPNPRRTRALRKPAIRKVWLSVAVADMFREYVLDALVRSLLGQTLVFDRYVLDSEVDLALGFPEEEVDVWLSWRLFRRMCVKPDTWVFLDVPLELSRERSLQKDEPYPDDDQTAARRFERYQRVLCNHTVHVIDATQPVDVVHSEIMGVLTSRARAKKREYVAENA